MSNVSSIVNQLQDAIASISDKAENKVSEIEYSTKRLNGQIGIVYEDYTNFKDYILESDEYRVSRNRISSLSEAINKEVERYDVVRRELSYYHSNLKLKQKQSLSQTDLINEYWSLQSSYWLNYIYLAILASENQYEELARVSTREAMRLEPLKTSLFLCLLHQKKNDKELAKKWLTEYFKRLNPTDFNKENLNIFFHYLSGNFGEKTEIDLTIFEVFRNWFSNLKTDSDTSIDMLNCYEEFIKDISYSFELDAPNLLSHCSNIDEWKDYFDELGKVGELNSIIDGLSYQKNQVFYNMDNNLNFDAIFNELISTTDPRELELLKLKHVLTQNAEGDNATYQTPKKNVTNERIDSDRYNLAEKMIEWVISEKEDDKADYLRKVGFENTVFWFKKAVLKYATQLSHLKPNSYSISIGRWKTETKGFDEEAQIELLKHHFESRRFNYMYFNQYNIIALVILVVSLGFASLSYYFLIGSLLAMGFLGYRIKSAKDIYDKHLEEDISKLKSCYSELQILNNTKKDYIDKMDELKKKIDNVKL